MNNYVVSAHKSSAVSLTAVGNFFSPHERNLLVCRNARIDVYTFGDEGLIHTLEIPVYGRIAVMKACRPPNESLDHLLILTERYRFCVLKWNASTRDFDTIAGGDVKDRIHRHGDHTLIGCVDPEYRCFGLYLYERLFKIIPTDFRKEAYNIQIVDFLEDVTFLHGCSTPTIALLYKDRDRNDFVKVLEIPQDGSEPSEIWKEQLIGSTATSLIPVPAPVCGVLVVGETITYLPSKPDGRNKSIPISPASIQAVGVLDERKQKFRYLLGDENGGLWLLLLQHKDGVVTKLKLEPLGVTSSASAISYLDNGFVFVGSLLGDSQLIKLHTEPDPKTSMNLEVMAVYENIGPVVDFCVLEMERSGQEQIITCSGDLKDGSLRIIQNGIGINEQASISLPASVKGMFSLKRRLSDTEHAYLVQSYTAETRILEMVSAEELQEAVIEGFDHDSATLYAANMVADTIVQITSSAARLIDCDSKKALDTWKPPENSRIAIANGNVQQLLISASGGILVYVEVDSTKRKFVEKASKTLENDISCLDCSPLGDGSTSEVAVVGTWKDVSVHFFSLPNLEAITKEAFGGEAIARSLLLVTLRGMHYFLLATGDGEVFVYRIKREVDRGVFLTEKRKISVGTQAVSLSKFTLQDKQYVFAACDRPTVLHAVGASRQLLCSNVNLFEVTNVVSFHSEAFPDSLAITTEDSLIIGSFADVHKLQIRTIPLKESPRRIAHHSSTRAIVVLCEAIEAPGGEDPGRESAVRNFVRVFDNVFQKVDSYELTKYELGMSVICTSFKDDPEVDDDREYVIVGTVYEEPHLNNQKGRILVFAFEENKLILVSEASVSGCVYTMKPFMGGIACGVVSQVIMLRWRKKSSGEMFLMRECAHIGHTHILSFDTMDDRIATADIFKSISLLKYYPDRVHLRDLARDFDANWMTAMAMIDKEHILGSENSHNMFTLCWQSNSLEEEEYRRLEKVGEFHLGDMINTIRRGTLNPHLGDAESSFESTHLFATVSGMIGVIAQLKPDVWAFFQKVQNAMNEVVKGVGGLRHDEWRSFTNERRTSEARRFLDGDLIERYLDLQEDQMERIARAVDSSVEELSARVEELTRIH